MFIKQLLLLVKFKSHTMKTSILNKFENYKITNLNSCQGGGSYPQHKRLALNDGEYLDVYHFADGSSYYEYSSGTSFYSTPSPIPYL